MVLKQFIEPLFCLIKLYFSLGAFNLKTTQIYKGWSVLLQVIQVLNLEDEEWPRTGCVCILFFY